MNNALSKYLYFLILLIIFCGCNSNQDERRLSCSEIRHGYRNIINSFTEEEQIEETKALLANSIKSSPSCKDAYILQADLYLYQDSLTKALMNYEKAVAIDTNNIYSYYKCGLIYDLRHNYDSAIYFFNYAISKKTHDGYVQTDLEPLSDLKGERNYDVEYNKIIIRLATAFYYNGSLDDSYKYFDYCIRKKYMPDEAYYYRGRIAIEMKKLNQGCDDLQKAAQLGNTSATEFLSKYCK